MLHTIVLVFFISLLLYSLFIQVQVPVIEGLDGGCGSDPAILSKTNANEVENIKKRMEELKDIKSRVDTIEDETNKTTDGLKKMKENEEKRKNEKKPQKK
jgi:hypothetical protein